MATIYPNKKDGKIISVKLKAYLGRDEHGKQIFRCKNWIPEKDMTEKKLLALAEKEAILFEYEATTQYPVEKDYLNDLIEIIQTKVYVAHFGVQELPKILKEVAEKR